MAADFPSAKTEPRYRFEFDRASDDGMPVRTVVCHRGSMTDELSEDVNRHQSRGDGDRLNKPQSENSSARSLADNYLRKPEAHR
jgi:hypothetical protein